MAAKVEPPSTVMEALRKVQSTSLLVPAMQREFVWRDDQIVALFDSAMRGYPVGTLLLWRLSADVAKKWRWFRCHTDLRRDQHANHQTTPVIGKTVDAVLDGQQRLTAFNIGVHGSVTFAKAGGQPEKRFLWLNATYQAKDLQPGVAKYQFSFHPDDWAARSTDGRWVKVSKASTLASRQEARAALGSGATVTEVDALDRLRKVLRLEPILLWQVIEDDDIDAILNIFIRANSKATQLGYDDMLLAIANSTWTKHDANEVKALRANLDNRFRLGISQTRIMKSALALSGAPQVGFRASNLTRPRLRAIDNDWDQIRDATWIAAHALHRFGLRRGTLTAENVLIPVAIYVHHRRLDAGWITGGASAKDRERVRRFVFRSLLQPEFWTGAVDQLLLLCRQVITSRPRQAQFPLKELSDAIEASKLGKRLSFRDEDIDGLVRMRYRDRNALLLLTAMYPDAAALEWLDKDHVFPKSKINPNALKSVGIPAARLSELVDMAEQLPNLCLLSDEDNRWWKQARMPAQWLDEVRRQAGTGQRSLRVRSLDLQHAPSSVATIEAFWDTRRARTRTRIKAVLGSTVV